MLFPDIPGCLGVGDTPDEAIEEGKQALFACLDALKAVDRKPPLPAAPAG
ncbi:MAG TPA: type II toxin-antitoxin system HicB family antitoxin [Methylocella sp.]|nr:type II toxin-antitoxin system HicB family antitoxin [Methylocella sp.]